MRFLYFILSSITLVSCSDEYVDLSDKPDPKKQAKELLGQKLFSETKLSNPEGQSCISCHDPATGFSDPLHRTVSPGVVTNLFGNRNAPSIAYAIFSPTLQYNTVDQTYFGGLFLDGRKNTLEEQAIGPLLNPVEMNNTSIAMVASKIKSLAYFNEFQAIYGTTSDDNELVNQFANAITAFELSRKVNSFTSKFDYVNAGLATFTDDEKKGLQLFQGKANCAACHTMEPDPITKKILFTDFTYDNIGVPKNNTNPFYTMPTNINPAGVNYIDLGIGQIVNQSVHNGKFKVPTLRNVAVSAPYFHNGSFNTLEDVIHFYNKRKVENLGIPEVLQNVNDTELGDLKLTIEEERQLKKFLETLTDHYKS